MVHSIYHCSFAFVLSLTFCSLFALCGIAWWPSTGKELSVILAFHLWILEPHHEKSKKKSNDQELIQSDPTSCPINQKETTKYTNRRQSKKGTRGKPNEQLLPK